MAAADRFYKAFLSGDEDVVSRITSENYLQTDVNGHVQDKKAWLDEPGGSTSGPRTLRFTQIWARDGQTWTRAVVHNAWVPEAPTTANAK